MDLESLLSAFELSDFFPSELQITGSNFSERITDTFGVFLVEWIVQRNMKWGFFWSIKQIWADLKRSSSNKVDKNFHQDFLYCIATFCATVSNIFLK